MLLKILPLLSKQLQYFSYYIATVALAQPYENNNHLTFLANKNPLQSLVRSYFVKQLIQKQIEYSQVSGEVPSDFSRIVILQSTCKYLKQQLLKQLLLKNQKVYFVHQRCIQSLTEYLRWSFQELLLQKSSIVHVRLDSKCKCPIKSVGASQEIIAHGINNLNKLLRKYFFLYKSIAKHTALSSFIQLTSIQL